MVTCVKNPMLSIEIRRKTLCKILVLVEWVRERERERESRVACMTNVRERERERERDGEHMAYLSGTTADTHWATPLPNECESSE
jgi:hypothetical protein